MSHNIFGHLFRVMTWGESHGPAIGCVIDGCPPQIRFKLSEIQKYLDQRRPGQSKYTTQRKESDQVKILSGVLPQGKEENDPCFITTGTPISLMIENEDQRTKDYSNIANIYRPGHADYSYDMKYGIRDYRGGGRSSARETAMRVAAGAIARKILPNVSIKGALVSIGPYKISRDRWDWCEVEKNPFFCPDKEMVDLFSKYLNQIRKEGSSVGAIIELHATGVPKGLGAPIYGKLDQDIAGLLMSINAVKAVEIGNGFLASTLKGEENNDQMICEEESEKFLTNHSGGILGGISTGEPIIARFYVKPTPSILTKQKTITSKKENQLIEIKGRHDPCVGIRAVPVGEAMLACILADHYLRHKGQVLI